MSTIGSIQHLAKRRCYYSYGQRYCDSWSNGARIGVGVAVAVGIVIFILLILGLGARRRRRMASNTQPMFNANQQQQQPSQGSYYQGQGAYPQTGYNTGGQYPNQGYYYPQQQQQQQQQDNPIGPEIGGFKYPPQRDENTGGQTYAPPSGPPPGVGSTYGGAPAVPPPAYAEDADKRV